MKKETRELLLDSAFNEFYQNGYQGASVAAILAEVGINKGSMYHFFKSKKALALAVIKERISNKIENKYTKVLEADESFLLLFKTLHSALDTLVYGCPLNKMSQEMVYIDKDFSDELSKVYETFESLINKILIKAVADNVISANNTLSNARLIISSYEGALMMYHLNKDEEAFIQVLQSIEKQLRS